MKFPRWVKWFSGFSSLKFPDKSNLSVKAAPITDDSTGWQPILRSGTGPADRPWSDHLADLADSFQAWRFNPWARQIVRLTTAYVVSDVGESIPVRSTRPEVQAFIEAFWNHPENLMSNRLASWCDELTRAGELFPVLFTNRFDGMSYVRAIPASSIQRVVSADNDYEAELGYEEAIPGKLEPKVWQSWRTAKTRKPSVDNRHYQSDPVMLHYPVNRAIGMTRGEPDLTCILPWVNRYTEFLKERVLFVKLRNKLAITWIKVADPNQVEAKREYYRANPPEDGAVLVTGPDEEVSFPNPNIQGFQAEHDGKVLRLAMAAGANLSLVHFGEGDTANLSTTVSMDDRTFRTNSQRQGDLSFILTDLTGKAYRRYRAVKGQPVEDGENLGISCKFSDISRSDNKELAEAARLVVQGLAELKATLGIETEKFREFAFSLAMKFAGEILEEAEVKDILGFPSKEQNGFKDSSNGTGLHSATVNPVWVSRS